jgi:hypothetical protein
MNLYKKAKGVSVYFAADCPDLRKNEIRPGSCKTKGLLPFQTNKPSKKTDKCQVFHQTRIERQTQREREREIKTLKRIRNMELDLPHQIHTDV